MISNIRNRIIRFTESKKEMPLLAAIASGLYPLVFYYYSNYTLINSGEQFVFFLMYFLGIPIISFYLVLFITKKIPVLKPSLKFAIPVLNGVWMAYLLVIITKGFHLKFILLALFVAIVGAILVSKHFKKIIVFQLLLALMAIVLLIKYMIFEIESPKTWLEQPDDIEQVQFKKKPNIYFIQPDGYANSSELGRGYYNFDNSDFENYLERQNFKIYSNYRSNYYSTLGSNSSLFGMKHHYHNFPKSKIREVYNARDVIVGKNPVVDIFKSNGYRTNLILGKSYLLANRPDMNYDHCNINFDEFTYFSRGFHISKDVLSDLKVAMETSNATPNFFFIEELAPSHVTNKKNPGAIADSEREKYLTRLKETNEWLKNVIEHLSLNDTNSIIIIAADHGGFVGMDTTLQSREKQSDRDLIYSIFTSQLAIKWPNSAPKFDNKLKTPVNFFRILFSYLSEDECYLEHLQSDKSYIQIEKGAPFGVYEYINENGEVVFNKVSKQ